MFSAMRRKTCTIFAILLVCTMAAALLACQIHAASSEDGHAAQGEDAAPLGHHQSSSPYTTGYSACLIAILPTVMFLVWFAFAWFHASLCFVRLTPGVFLPFRPPKTAVH